MDQRKASDILLSLESEVKSMQSKISLQDILLKTLLNSLNKNNELITSLIGGKSLHEGQNPNVINIPAGPPINVVSADDLKGERRVGRVPETTPKISTKASNVDIEFNDYMAQRKKLNNPQEPVENIESPNNSIEQKQQRKIPITQRVQDNFKKDLFMAEVNVSTLKGDLVIKTKTNAMGKWQAQLPAGKYNVKISKMDTAQQKKLESEQEIVVPLEASGPVALPIVVINRN